MKVTKVKFPSLTRKCLDASNESKRHLLQSLKKIKPSSPKSI